MDDNVREFESVEAMLAHMAEEERKANEGLHQRQRVISFGDYVLRPHQSGLLIFGYVQERAERDALEDQETIAMLDESHERGYMTGMWYSALCVEGEPGSAHRVTLWPIFKEEFDAAKALDFKPITMAQQPWFREMLMRIDRERATPARGATADEDGVGFVEAEEDTSP